MQEEELIVKQVFLRARLNILHNYCFSVEIKYYQFLDE